MTLFSFRKCFLPKWFTTPSDRSLVIDMKIDTVFENGEIIAKAEKHYQDPPQSAECNCHIDRWSLSDDNSVNRICGCNRLTMAHDGCLRDSFCGINNLSCIWIHSNRLICMRFVRQMAHAQRIAHRLNGNRKYAFLLCNGCIEAVCLHLRSWVLLKATMIATFFFLVFFFAQIDWNDLFLQFERIENGIWIWIINWRFCDWRLPRIFERFLEGSSRLSWDGWEGKEGMQDSFKGEKILRNSSAYEYESIWESDWNMNHVRSKAKKPIFASEKSIIYE